MIKEIFISFKKYVLNCIHINLLNLCVSYL